MVDELSLRASTPEDWSELELEFEDANDYFENDAGDMEQKQEVVPQKENLPKPTFEQCTLDYGRELERQIDKIQQEPRPPFETVKHLQERLERENELYRKQFAWQMENMIRFTTNAQ
ncbi:unnamed protein product [Cylicostephanus goldi]|uniref:Uncharacterized protein n=1 Tax=Cylicostephanus goldi TaxID=71465 RepID=A0A3P6QLA6_CYLGO|nr:unnamed protein product [Cylicostephanus goldi]